MEKKGGLSRGLGAFIKNTEKLESISSQNDQAGVSISGSVVILDIDDISANPDQPRRDFDRKSLEDLASSIKEIGLIQPILVKKEDDTYRIIAGERRYRASKMAGLDTIEAIVKDLDDLDSDRIALIENIQRQDLNPFEEATAYRQMIDTYQLSQQDLADYVGKSRSYIANTLRLLNLDPRVLELLKEKKISQSLARELLSIEDLDYQYSLAREAVDKGLTVAQILDKKKTKVKRHTRSVPSKDIHILDLESEFENALATKVSIDDRKKTISIDYYDNDDLQRIIEIIIGE